MMAAAGLQVLEEWDAGLRGGDPLGYPGYAAQLREAEAESVVTGLTRLGSQHAALIETRFDRFGGTMGAAAGEKIARAFDQAAARRLPVVAVTATGGARLQEGMLALVQMGRTVAARGRHASAGLLMAAIYGSPTTGGVYASWAALADVRAGLSGATIGFGGPRVVELVTGQPPPATSHTAESAYAAGRLDAVLPAGSEVGWLAAALGAADRPLALPAWRRPVHAYPGSGSGSGSGPGTRDPAGSGPAASGSQAIRAVRAAARPSGLEWAAALCTSWTDLHGTDPAIRAGLASIGGQRLVVIAMDRHATANAAARPGPAAYRLAQRAIRLAARLRLPLLTLVDTPGAEPGPAAEADGIAAEIAGTIALMADIPTVSVCVCVGEGGSGGAMALGYADRLLMLAGSVFSVIGPEAAALILRRKPSAASQVADALGITGAALGRLGLVDGLLPDGGDISGVRSAILAAFGQAAPGDRARRPDEVTRRWLRAGYLRTQP
jgi:acetyl-CoA carboxylase alpha subunit